MKKLLLILLFALIFSGCQKEAQSFPELPEKAPTTVALTTMSLEEELAQSIERASNYKLDVYDIRLIHDNEFGLPLRPDVEFPIIYTVIFIIEDLEEPEVQIVWDSIRTAVKRLAGSENVKFFYTFWTHSGVLQRGSACEYATVNVQLYTETSCSYWPGISALPPETTRFMGF